MPLVRLAPTSLLVLVVSVSVKYPGQALIYLRISVSGYPNKICNEFKVVEAFAYINFIIRASFPFSILRGLRDIFSALLYDWVNGV
jgi:hypothetical protein